MASPKTGRLVAICGIDGSGKATQTELLAGRAREEGLDVREVSFPRYGQGFFADLVERYLRGDFAEQAGDVDPHLAALPYALDRWQTSGELREWLAGGSLVICNRYVPANLAHQGSKLASPDERQEFVAWIEELEYDVLGIPRPDLQVLLDVPVSVSMRLVRERAAASGGSLDIHEEDLGHLEAAAAVYREVAARDADAWAVIPCADGQVIRPPEAIAADVWARVAAIL